VQRSAGHGLVRDHGRPIAAAQPEHAGAAAVNPTNGHGDAIMPAAARPYWTGFLKLSLVTVAVRLYAAATGKDRIHFHMIHEPSGERVRAQTVVPGLGPGPTPMH
jgi:hypothetical protein